MLLLALPSPVVAAGGCCFCCSASSGCRGICTTGLPGWISWAKTSHIITAHVQSTESSGEKEGINLRACCCASTPWTIAPHRATPGAGQCLSGVAAVACRQPRHPGDLSAGPWPGQRSGGWMDGACSLARDHRHRQPAPGHRPWMPCPGCARSLAGGGESRLGGDGAGPCWQPSPSGNRGSRMPSGNSFAAAA